MTMINGYAIHEMQQKLAARQYSRYSNWSPITRYEPLKLIAVLIAMGIDCRSNRINYWCVDTFNYTPWYHKIFSRN